MFERIVEYTNPSSVANGPNAATDSDREMPSCLTIVASSASEPRIYVVYAAAPTPVIVTSRSRRTPPTSQGLGASSCSSSSS